MLGYRHAACRCNERRRSRDIERADLVSTRADNIHDRALRFDVRSVMVSPFIRSAVSRVAISISVAVPSIISSIVARAMA